MNFYNKKYIFLLTFYTKSYIIILSGGSTSPDIESCEDGIRILRGPGATEVTAAPNPDNKQKKPPPYQGSLVGRGLCCVTGRRRGARRPGIAYSFFSDRAFASAGLSRMEPVMSESLMACPASLMFPAACCASLTAAASILPSLII